MYKCSRSLLIFLMHSAKSWFKHAAQDTVIRFESHFGLLSKFHRRLAAGSIFAFCVPHEIEVIYLLALSAPRNVELNLLHPF